MIGGNLQAEVEALLRGTKWEYGANPIPAQRRPRRREFTVAGPQFDWGPEFD